MEIIISNHAFNLYLVDLGVDKHSRFVLCRNLVELDGKYEWGHAINYYELKNDSLKDYVVLATLGMEDIK